jgi:ribonucleoside-diphosphate reductase alpha chain
MTGIASGKVLDLNMTEASDHVKLMNRLTSKTIGIKSAARCTTVKPAGTTSLVLGTSSGIHAWHNKYYVRRMRVGKNEAIYSYLTIHHPELLEDDYFRPHDTAVISIPQKAPKGAITRNESTSELLERVKEVATKWVKPGHRRGSNTHNVSATISVKDKGWDFTGEWMWANRDHYNGLAVLPYDGGTYVQAPFEDITKKKYDEMTKRLHEIDLSKVIELEDQTDLSGELACAGGNCEITSL